MDTVSLNERRQSDQPVAELLRGLLDETSLQATLRLAFYLTGDREAALDLAQEAYARALEYGPSLRDAEAVQGWFRRIVVNLCRDWIRRRQTERAALSRREPAPGSQSDPADACVRQETLERLRRQVLALPPELREAVVLVNLEGHAPKAAAEILGVPDGTLRWRLHEARRQLKEALEAESRE
jgi:RNA polymerase sigma-70 factor (ECF subfamily)